MQKLISVIIPVYNRTDKFRGALSSVVQQTYKDIEIIVVDDGSYTDAVEYAMRDMLKFQKYDAQKEKDATALSHIEHIQYIRQENKGAPSARNKGLELARGEYVIFWDADVVAEPDMLQKMVEVLEKNNEASFVYCNFTLLPMSKKMKAQQFNLDALKKNNYIHTTSLIRRKDIIKWDEALKRFQDWDLWLTMGEHGKKGVWFDEYLFCIRGGGTMSSWLPSFTYKKPWCYLPWIKSRVKKYEEAKNIVLKKHNIF
ncbi:MAG: glycosyltransferase family A protein [Candidatus Magasanikbacteria bacterium]